MRRPAPFAAGGTAELDLSWVDGFIAAVRPYIFVRREDDVLIKRPNRAQKLNHQGAVILDVLLSGTRVDQVLRAVRRDPAKVRDITVFLREVRRFVDDAAEEAGATTAVEVRPFTLNFSTLPILSEVAITYRCNLQCSFCYAGCNCTRNPVGDGREMTEAEIRRVLRTLFHEARVPSVSFTGGEPTLRADLPRLVQYAKRLGMWVNLITNGVRMTPTLARTLADAGLDSAQVSLEGASAETHDRVTGARGAFGRAVAAVGHLKYAGIRVHTNTTIQRENLDECARMPEFVRNVLGNDRFSMNLMMPAGSGALSPGLVVTYEEIGEHLERIAAESRRCGVEFMWYSPTPMCIFNPVSRGMGNKGCSACDGLISVAANGEVIPCSSYDESVGDLLHQDFHTIWRGERAARFRSKSLAYPACHGCEDFAVCNGACPLYWRSVGFGELERRRGAAPRAVRSPAAGPDHRAPASP